MNELGFADVVSRGGAFSPDPQDVTDRLDSIHHENEAEEKAMFEKLQEANREADRDKGLHD